MNNIGVVKKWIRKSLWQCRQIVHFSIFYADEEKQEMTCWPNGKAPDYGSGDSGFESRAGFFMPFIISFFQTFFSSILPHTASSSFSLLSATFISLHLYTIASHITVSASNYVNTYKSSLHHILTATLSPDDLFESIHLIISNSPFLSHVIDKYRFFQCLHVEKFYSLHFPKGEAYA